MMIQLTQEWITPILSAIGGGLATFLTIRKTLVKDELTITRDKTEIEFLNHLEKSRDNAVQRETELRQVIAEVQMQHNDCISKNRELLQDIDNLLIQVRLLNEVIRTLQNQLQNTKEVINQQIAENVHLKSILGETKCQTDE